MAGQLSRRTYNLLITNVPGPQVPLYAAGYPVVAMYPVAPLTVGHAMAVSCTSYNGGVFFGVTADREAVPDVEEFGLLVAESLAELLDTVPSSRPRRASDRPRRRATRPASVITRPRPPKAPDR